MFGIAAYAADGKAYLTSETYSPVYVKDATYTGAFPRIGAWSDLLKPVMECHYTVTGIKKPMPFIVAAGHWVAIFAVEKTGTDAWKIVAITTATFAPRVLVFDQYDPATPSNADAYGMRVWDGSGAKIFDSASTRKPINLKAALSSPLLESYVYFTYEGGRYYRGNGYGNYWYYRATGDITLPIPGGIASPAVNFLSTGQAWWGAWFSGNQMGQYQAFSCEMVKCIEAGANFSVGHYNQTTTPPGGTPTINGALHSRSKPVLVIDASLY